MRNKNKQKFSPAFTCSKHSNYFAFFTKLFFFQEAQYGWPHCSSSFDAQPCRASVATKETQTEKKISCFRQFLNCVVADEEFRRERQRAAAMESSINSVSRIDKISRVLFPVSFMILNIIYWIFYTHRSDECPRMNTLAQLNQRY